MNRYRSIIFFCCLLLTSQLFGQTVLKPGRQKHLINDNWKFFKYQAGKSDSLIYDVRPEVTNDEDGKPADARPTEAIRLEGSRNILKPWIMPTSNAFIKDASKRYTRPTGNPGAEFPFVQDSFDDSSWEEVDLPHDWAIKGPFYEGWNTEIGGGMGRLPVQGVAWYRRKIDILESDKGRQIFLDIDGAMSYAMVWVNGKLAGGWPYGYTSFRIDLSPYLNYGGINQLAIRLDNPKSSSRWYPGAGIYRNVWLTKTNPVYVGHWGTFITTREVSTASAIADVSVSVENRSDKTQTVSLITEIFLKTSANTPTGKSVAKSKTETKLLAGGTAGTFTSNIKIANPKLWGPVPEQKPHLYQAVTTVLSGGKAVDTYESTFGIRDIKFDANKGVFVNGIRVELKGANQHHDLGALGAAFNVRAAERQLKLLQEMGCNAIRMAHNPPDPQLLDLTDKMGFLVVNEIYDSWERKKTPLDFHLVFPEWQEQDLRALIRRDRNHPSVIMWSFGNEVGEQYTDEDGARLAKKLNAIVKEEDQTRPTTVSMNYAKPHMPLPAVVDVISLNYQGEGIRNGPAYSGLKGINTPPLFPAFHQKFPDKVIISSENAAALSSRGEYMFPVFEGNSSPVRDTLGGNPKTLQVSAYELYSVDFGASADKVFASMDKHPYVAGGFVWSGWDYLGEPTPYYLARSSYFGIIDLAGFKKDRFYLYQSRWRPDHPVAHILPHWNWPERLGKVTPVHVFTSGDEAELFLNGKSLGRKKKAEYEYRLRWDDVIYKPGELKVVAFKNGEKWAESSVRTTGKPQKLEMKADRNLIKSDGQDLAFVTVKVTDEDGTTVPTAKNHLKFSIEGPGEIIATDNGDAANLVSFASRERETFNGLCLVIIKAKPHQIGNIILRAVADGLKGGTETIRVQP